MTTVAVAAFDDFTASPADAAFATGLAEDIETALARVPGLRVLSRRATRALGPSPAPQDVGRRLDAGSVLQGSVRVADGNVRVSARLLRTTDGSSLWARSFDAPRQQAFALQDALAASIATTLRGALLSQATPPARTVNAEAQTRLWNGRSLRQRRTPESLIASIAQFQQATTADPLFADAFAALGDAYANAGFHNTIVPGEAIPLARRASMRAIELDPGQSQAHGTIGAIAFFFDHDWTTAEAAFQRAIVANPSYAACISGSRWA